eukprot:scaffold3898_cov401-Prasinococcus_capsulatus_cf.AAC.4
MEHCRKGGPQRMPCLRHGGDERSLHSGLRGERANTQNTPRAGIAAQNERTVCGGARCPQSYACAPAACQTGLPTAGGGRGAGHPTACREDEHGSPSVRDRMRVACAKQKIRQEPLPRLGRAVTGYGPCGHRQRGPEIEEEHYFI